MSPAKKKAKRSARTATRKVGRSAARTAPTAKPRLRVIRPKPPKPPKPVIAPAAPTSFPQRGEASAKQLVIFELIRARATLLGAIHGLSPGAANEPMSEGGWSVRETVLHLVTRDQARLRESEPTLHGQPATWRGVPDPEMDRINAELVAPLRHADWDEALRLLHRVREQLMEEVESVPESPAEVWSPEHPFGWMLHALSTHDRHHAGAIKRWRAERGA